MTFVLLVVGTGPIAYIRASCSIRSDLILVDVITLSAVVVVSALIFVLGIDLVKEALWDTRHRVNRHVKVVSQKRTILTGYRMEYITMISIIVTMTVWDFVIGVFLGIIASCQHPSLS